RLGRGRVGLRVCFGTRVGLVSFGGGRVGPFGLARLVRPVRLVRLSWPLPVLPVVGDVEARALEDEPGPARDLPGCHPAANGTLGPRLLGHLLEQLELMPLRALVL